MGSGFGISSAVTGAISSAVDAYKKNSEIMDTSGIESSIDDISSRELNYGNFDSLMSDYGSYNPAYTGYSMQDLRGQNYGKMALTTLANTGQAAINGMASTGSPYGLLAGVPALAAGVGGIFAGNSKASSRADELNRQGEYANAMYIKNFANNASNIRNDMFNKATLNMKAFGGKMSPFVKSRLLSSSFKMKPRKMKYGGFGHYYAYGGDMSGEWTNGVTEINAGGTHEMNEYGGVPIGLDMNGTPNLVEEGEVVFNDYVYSNRLKPTEKQLDSVKLNTKYKGKTYAEIAKDLQRESSNRPLDPISKNTLVDSMSKLTAIQEESRQFEMMKQLVEQLQQMTPEEQMGLMQNVPMEAMGQPMDNTSNSSIPFGSQEGFTPDNQRAYRSIQEEMNEGMLAPEEQMALGGFVNIGANGIPLRRYIPFRFHNHVLIDNKGKDWGDHNPAGYALLKTLGYPKEGFANNISEAEMDAINAIYNYFIDFYGDSVEAAEGYSDELIEYVKQYWDKYGSPDWEDVYLGFDELSDEDFEREYKLYKELGEEEYFRRQEEARNAEYDRRIREAEELDRQEAANKQNSSNTNNNEEDASYYFDNPDIVSDGSTDIEEKVYEDKKETKEEIKERRKAEREAKRRERENARARAKEERESRIKQRKAERERKKEERNRKNQKEESNDTQNNSTQNNEQSETEYYFDEPSNVFDAEVEVPEVVYKNTNKQTAEDKALKGKRQQGLEQAIEDGYLPGYMEHINNSMLRKALGINIDDSEIDNIQNEQIDNPLIKPNFAIQTKDGVRFTDEIFKPKLINEELLRKRLEELMAGRDVNGLPYTDKFKYFNNGKYDEDYENFVKNFKFGEASGKYGADVYNALSKIYKEVTGNDLTTDEAKNLGLDKKFGIFHDIWAQAMEYNPETNPMMSTPELPLDIDFDYDTEHRHAIDEIQNGQIDSPKVKVDLMKEKQDNVYPRMNGMQFAPVFGSAIGAIGSLFEKPEYTAADYMARGRRGIRDVRGRVIGNYLTYNPYDINYAANNLAQISLGATRGINNTAANAGQAIAGTLMQNANLMRQMGDLRMKAREYNDQQRRAVADFNRQTDLQNAQFGQQADMQNSNLDLQRANLLAQEGQIRDNVNTAMSQRRSAAFTNLFNNIGNVGTTKYNADKAQWLFDMGYIPNATKSCGGKIKRKKRLLK